MITLSELKNGLHIAGARVTLALYVQPNARKSEFDRIHDDQLKLKIKAVPEEGKANDEVVRFLSQFFSIKRNQVTIVSGHLSRHKRVEVIFDHDVSLTDLTVYFHQS